MRLSNFIQNNLEAILLEWDKFARSQLSDEDKTNTYLVRDHAREMLLELTADMRTEQSAQQQLEKSQGIVSPFHADDSAATVHGVMRHDDGFTVSQVAAEFRALRAVVLRFWLPKVETMSNDVIVDIVRFNESIDMALAESIVSYRS